MESRGFSLNPGISPQLAARRTRPCPSCLAPGQLPGAAQGFSALGLLQEPRKGFVLGYPCRKKQKFHEALGDCTAGASWRELGMHRGIGFQFILSETRQHSQGPPNPSKTNLGTCQGLPVPCCAPLCFPSVGHNCFQNDEPAGRCSHLAQSGCAHTILLFIPAGISTFWFSAPVRARGKFGQKKKNLKLNQILSLDLKQMTLKEPKKSSKE